MAVTQSPMVQFKEQHALFEEHTGMDRLKKALLHIQQICEDERVIFDNDRRTVGPLLEKWGIDVE